MLRPLMRIGRISQRFLVHGLVALAALAATLVACAGAANQAIESPDAGAADASRDGSSRRVDSGGEDVPDSGPKTICEQTRAYYEGCGNASDLNCGSAGFDAWCAANDKAINSETYRHAEALCLNEENCAGKDRRHCEYGHYADVPPTAAQKALVKAYCQTCEPGDVSGCTKRSTTYDPAKGIESVPDIFVAAWELADDVVDEMKSTCTGDASGDAGADPVACAKAFATCAGDIYLARLPDCAK